jgi:hypothetical protein
MATPNPERVKFTYNAQFPAATAIVLDYLLNSPHFTSRQGRQKGMDAIAAFYRPMAEEARGELPEEQIQEVARNCVEVLSKHIDELRKRYRLEGAVADDSQPHSSGRLEEILVTKLDAIANAIRAQSGIVRDGGANNQGLHTTLLYDFEQGITMEVDELGDLEVTLDDIRSEYVS